MGSDPTTLLGQTHGLARAAELALHATASRERPLGHHDRLPVCVVEGVLEEPRRDQLDQSAVAEGVPDPRGHVVHGRARVLIGLEEGVAGHRDDRGHHQIDRDDVGDALGHAGELPEQAPRVGDDDRLGHPEAADPARVAVRRAPIR